MRRAFWSALVLLFAAGCTQGIPPLNFSVPNISPSERKVFAEVKSVTVAFAAAEEQERKFDPGDEIIAPIWKTALEEALNRSAIFQDDSKRKISISVKIIKIYFPPFGMEFTTTTAAVYQVLDRLSGAVLYSERIESIGTTPSNFAFLGVARARESVNRSVQANITKFISCVSLMRLGLPQQLISGS